MKAIYKINESMTFELEATHSKDMFEQLASLHETFGTKACGKCKKTLKDTPHLFRYVVREVDGNTYYEIVCQNCSAKLAFSSTKKDPNNLFEKKKEDYRDADSKWLPDNGWQKWNPATKQME